MTKEDKRKIAKVAPIFPFTYDGVTYEVRGVVHEGQLLLNCRDVCSLLGRSTVHPKTSFMPKGSISQIVGATPHGTMKKMIVLTLEGAEYLCKVSHYPTADALLAFVDSIFDEFRMPTSEEVEECLDMILNEEKQIVQLQTTPYVREVPLFSVADLLRTQAEQLLNLAAELERIVTEMERQKG